MKGICQKAQMVQVNGRQLNSMADVQANNTHFHKAQQMDETRQ